MSVASTNNEFLKLKSQEANNGGGRHIGVEGITGVTPTGLTSGDSSSLQSMLEGIASIALGTFTLDPYRMIYTGATGVLTAAAAATNGQLLIGSTGAAPVAASIAGTSNQVTVTNGAGSITLSLPQNIHTAATPTFAGITVSGLSASRLVATNGSSALSSVSSLSSWISGTANRVTVSDDGDGTVTLNLPQDIHTGASPTLTGLTLSGLAGTGTRLTTSTSAGVQGNATTIDGNYTFNGTLTFSSPSLTYTANRVLVTNSSGLVLTSGNITWNNTTAAFAITGTAAISGNSTIGGTLSVANSATFSNTVGFIASLNAVGNSDNHPLIYGSAEGGSDPFNLNGHLILQGRTGGGSGRDIIFYTGTTPTIRYRLTTGGAHSFTGSVAMSSTLSVTGVQTNAQDLVFSASRTIRRDVQNSSLDFSGGNNSSDGANIALFGSTHATLANNWRIRHSSTNDIAYNGSSITITPPTVLDATLSVTGVSKFGTGTITFASKNLTVIGTSFDGTSVQFENTDVDTVANGRAFNFGITDVSGTNGRFDLTQPGVRTVLSVFSNGNVGIGSTTDGGQAFQVTGTSRFTGTITTGLTASLPVFTNGSSQLTTNAMTGSGSVVMSVSPTLTGTISAAALTLSSTLDVSGLSTFKDRIRIQNLSASSDYRLWDIVHDSTALLFRARTDADGSNATWMTVNRGFLGSGIASVIFGSSVTVGNLTGTGTGSFSGAITLSNSSALAGTLLLTSTTAGNGLTIGGDTNLYRSAANTLATDDAMMVGGVSTLTNAPVHGVAGEHGFGGTWRYSADAPGSGTDYEDSTATPYYVKIKRWDGSAWVTWWLRAYPNQVAP